jgi:fructokinase
MTQLYGGIEAGGTKFVCAIGDADGKILEEKVFPTESPNKTLPAVIDFFQRSPHAGKIVAFGLGAFGPIDTDPASATCGYITSTPKKEWQQCPIVHTLETGLDKKIGLVTDVGAAALGEYYYGEGKHLSNILYMTVGTGIGAASVIRGHLLPMMDHQEIGHMLIPHDKTRDPFEGVCPYHHDCLEGLASGTAMKSRFNVSSAMHLPFDHEAWDLEADYLAAGLSNCLLHLSPHKIILGGGVMKQQHLIEMIIKKIRAKINGYVSLKSLEEIIVPPGLADRSGVMGCIAVAQQIAQGDFYV